MCVVVLVLVRLSAKDREELISRSRYTIAPHLFGVCVLVQGTQRCFAAMLLALGAEAWCWCWCYLSFLCNFIVGYIAKAC